MSGILPEPRKLFSTQNIFRWAQCCSVSVYILPNCVSPLATWPNSQRTCSWPHGEFSGWMQLSVSTNIRTTHGSFSQTEPRSQKVATWTDSWFPVPRPDWPARLRGRRWRTCCPADSSRCRSRRWGRHRRSPAGPSRSWCSPCTPRWCECFAVEAVALLTVNWLITPWTSCSTFALVLFCPISHHRESTIVSGFLHWPAIG